MEVLVGPLLATHAHNTKPNGFETESSKRLELNNNDTSPEQNGGNGRSEPLQFPSAGFLLKLELGHLPY